MVIGACATQHRMRMLVGNMKLLKVDNDLALLQVAEELRPTAANAQQELSALLSTAWGQTVRVEIESLSPAPPRAVPSGESPAAQSAPTPASQPAGSDIRLPTSDIASHPLIKQAIDLFGARVIGVQPSAQAGGVVTKFVRSRPPRRMSTRLQVRIVVRPRRVHHALNGHVHRVRIVQPRPDVRDRAVVVAREDLTIAPP